MTNPNDGGDQVIRPAGVPSAEAFGTPTFTLGSLVARVATHEVVSVVENFTVRVLDDACGCPKRRALRLTWCFAPEGAAA